MTKGKILVVDDDISCLQLLASAVSMFGFDVCIASNGSEAISKLNSSFNAVVTDMHMGEGMLNGNDVALAAKEIQFDIKIVLIYSPNKIDPIDKLFDHIFCKPLNLGLLYAALSLIE